ncbi:MAG: TolC family protein [Myxococcota bacterium]
MISRQIWPIAVLCFTACAELPPRSGLAPRALLYALRTEARQAGLPSEGLTPAQAVALALIHNPELRARRLERSLAAGRVLSAELLKNPELRLSLRSVIEGNPLSLGSALRLYPQDELAKQAEIEVAEARSAQAEAELVALESEVAARALLEHAEALALEKKKRLYEASADLHRRLIALEEARLAERLATRLDLVLTRLRMDELDQRALSVEEERHRALSKLARELGLPGQELSVRPGETRGSSAALARDQLGVPELEELAVDARADLRALRHGWEARDARVRQRLARAGAGLSFVEPGLAKLGDKPRLDLDAGIELPIFDDGTQGVRQAELQRALALEATMARLSGIRAELCTAAADRARAARRQAHFRAEVVPLLGEAEALIEEGLRTHAVDPVLIATVSARLLDARSAAIEAELAERKALISIASATGTILDALPE